jgi:hypothetical protein
MSDWDWLVDHGDTLAAGGMLAVGVSYAMEGGYMIACGAVIIFIGVLATIKAVLRDEP